MTRINYLGRFSALQASRATRDCFASPSSLARDLRVCDDRLDGPMVFIKNANVVKGHGDLSWHVDDGIGGHPVMCPLIQCGIQLDPANAQRTAQAARRLAPLREALDRVGRRSRPARGGARYRAGRSHDPLRRRDAHDALAHSPDAGRRALYYKFAEPKTFDYVPAHCHYNDALFRANAEGQSASRAAAGDAVKAY